MDGITCDACGEGLLLEEDVRYILRIEGFAAYDPMEITREDLARDLEAEGREVMEALRNLDAESAQNQVHRTFRFDLCPRCWERYGEDPLAGLNTARDLRRGKKGGEAEEKNEKSQGD